MQVKIHYWSSLNSSWSQREWPGQEVEADMCLHKVRCVMWWDIWRVDTVALVLAQDF